MRERWHPVRKAAAPPRRRARRLRLPPLPVAHRLDRLVPADARQVDLRRRDTRVPERTLAGQIIAHGWEVASVAPGEGDVAGVPIEYQVSVTRPTKHRPGDVPSAFVVTRIHVGDYETWKPMFDKDEPGARQGARGHRVLRSLDDPNEVFVLVEFASSEAANAARDKLLGSGVLDRFPDKTPPSVVADAETASY